MSYQVLARKWRPRGFDTLVGQEHVVRALTHALQQGRLHHAYLFTGTRGVGKTTIARILAKSLNCEAGVSAAPCGVCGACQEIDSGRFVDLLEVDAATNTRVDEMRQLLENAVYAPTRGRYKVYVIDEVHMLSNAAFNAMLKTLEEPPEHVKFILATTDPQKIPVTVLSRCLQFNLKQMSQANIATHLTEVLAAENIAAEEAALKLIARAANGSMRDALSLLDQAIAYGAGTVERNGVSAMLGTLDNDHLYEIVEALIEASPGELKAITDRLAARSLSYDAALAALAELWVQIQAAQLNCFGQADDDLPVQRCLDLAGRLGAEYVQLAYTITLQGRAQLSLAPDPAAGFLMTLLRLYAFRPDDSRAEKKNTLVERSPGNAGRSVACLPESIEPRKVTPIDPSGGSASLGAPLAAAKTFSAVDWPKLLSELNLAGLARELASHCELVEFSASAIKLRLSPDHRHLLSKIGQDKLTTALIGRFGNISINIAIGQTSTETPAEVGYRLRNQVQQSATAAIESDGVVRDLIESFDGTVIAASIRSLGG